MPIFASRDKTRPEGTMADTDNAETQRQKAAASLLIDMETAAARMRELIVGMPPQDLLGYLYAQYMLKAMSAHDVSLEVEEPAEPDDLINENQFLLEYVHAVLASDPLPEQVAFDEAKCAELYDISRKLRQDAMFYAMATSADTKDGAFGPDTADIEYRAKTTWVLMRGNRYQVLEGEIYQYVLAPHDDLLKEVYGVGAEDIAAGFQAMTDATRTGHSDAILNMMDSFDAVQAIQEKQGMGLQEAIKAWAEANDAQLAAARSAMDDMFRGGVANVSRHTKLPAELLADLAYRRGEDVEFFAAGSHAGTPYRTLPARKKPLILLGSDYYAVDPCFTRDAGYRALLFNLLQRKPDYKAAFNDRQKVMSEAAFADILSDQLPGARVFQEVYYRDPVTKQWSENDTLILIDDVMYLVEAKAGAAATIASPALDFARHAQSVQDLVIKAYRQCERFFNYLASSDEVPLYHLEAGKYVECARVRRADYRVMVPIGLTVESFSPLSAYCKELPQIVPLLGRHGFVSLSIDDLFVLRRLLPTPGQFAHYMEVRQAVAALRRAHLFDELDHLGAYLKKNRFDEDMTNQLKEGADFAMWDGMSFDVDRSFEGEDWEKGPFPTQAFPGEILKLLAALDASRSPGWLLAESRIRDLGEDGRNDLAAMLAELRKSLNQNPARYFLFGRDVPTPLFIWMQRSGEIVDWQKVNDKAAAAALLTAGGSVTGIMVVATSGGTYKTAYTFPVNTPGLRSEDNARIYDEADRMRERAAAHAAPRAPAARPMPARAGFKAGRNDPCPCGSGIKFKKCHGR
jgi:hypothetical protein